MRAQCQSARVGRGVQKKVDFQIKHGQIGFDRAITDREMHIFGETFASVACTLP
jgi:hypothetical protein